MWVDLCLLALAVSFLCIFVILYWMDAHGLRTALSSFYTLVPFQNYLTVSYKCIAISVLFDPSPNTLSHPYSFSCWSPSFNVSPSFLSLISVSVYDSLSLNRSACMSMAGDISLKHSQCLRDKRTEGNDTPSSGHHYLSIAPQGAGLHKSYSHSLLVCFQSPGGNSCLPGTVNLAKNLWLGRS